MPIIPLSHRDLQRMKITESEQGFTLIELLVVLAIMSLAAVLFIGATSSTGATASRDLAELESSIASARQQAITSGAIQKVILADYALDLRPAVGNASESLIFYADGSSNGGAIMRNDKQLFTVRWIDGCIIQ